MNIGEITTDSDLEQTGVWVKYEDAELLIAPTHTPRHNQAMHKHGKKFPAALAKSDMTVVTKIAIESMADAVLLDFKGLTNNGETLDGKNRAHRVMVLSIRVMREWISTQAEDIRNFQKGNEEEAARDLKSSPDVETEERS